MKSEGWITFFISWKQNKEIVLVLGQVLPLLAKDLGVRGLYSSASFVEEQKKKTCFLCLLIVCILKKWAGGGGEHLFDSRDKFWNVSK